MSTERKHARFGALSALIGVATASLVSGCLEEHNTPVADNKCTACHGDAQRSGNSVTKAAPPYDLNGNTQSSARGVGAHQAHLTASDTHVALACTECHAVPEEVFSPGHLNNPKGAKVTFGDGAKWNDFAPAYDPVSNSCSTYCHQSIQPSNSPNWRDPKDSTAACGTCHGLPPAAPHVQNDQCFQCHGSVIDKNRHFVNKALHINGKADTGDLSCNGCHGTGTYGAPAPDLEGNVATSAPGVGAHSIHLNASSTHGPVACATCHVVPANVDSPGHIDSSRPADVTFGELSLKANSQPAFDPSAHSCNGTYCHGAATPVWNAPRSSADACGSCHGLPPPAPHPQKADCSSCHSTVVDASRNFVNPSLHVNGELDVTPSCSSCHGSANDGSPPPDLSGNTSLSSPGVGAHQRHLQASGTHGAVACNQCHVVPAAWNSPGHDVTATPPAVITFGSLATQDHPSANYSPANFTCSNTYCHGSATPNWVAQRTEADACGTCHALPPAFVPNVAIGTQSHPKVADCSRCHGAVIDSNQQFVAPELHVNGGNPDVNMGCNGCHGSATSNAPPTDLSGNTSVTSLGVGAHQAHLSGGLVSRPVPCVECHVVPKDNDINAPGHIDDWSVAEVTFGGAAVAGNRSPIWNRQAANCTDSWCHSPTVLGVASPTWNIPSAILGCTKCHGTPPPAPHPQIAQCNLCHTNIRIDFTFVNRSKHVDGSVDF